MLIYLVMSLALFISILRFKLMMNILRISKISLQNKSHPSFSLSRHVVISWHSFMSCMCYRCKTLSLHYLAFYQVSSVHFITLELSRQYFEESAISFDPISKRLKTIRKLTAITLLFKTFNLYKFCIYSSLYLYDDLISPSN